MNKMVVIKHASPIEIMHSFPVPETAGPENLFLELTAQVQDAHTLAEIANENYHMLENELDLLTSRAIPKLESQVKALTSQLDSIKFVANIVAATVILSIILGVISWVRL